MSADRDVFPEGRFSIELVDALLETPCVFPVTDPVVTIGLSGGNSWNLPLEDMGLEFVKLWSNNEWWRRPLLTLNYCPKIGSWKATGTVDSSSTCSEPTTSAWDAAFSELEPGMRFQVRLPCSTDYPNGLGVFTILLHDSENPPSTFTQRLASLPDVPLGIIASYLHPVHCIRHLCSFGQSVAGKLCFAKVQWRGMCFLDIKTDGDGIENESLPQVEYLLDCLRVAKLLCNGDCLKVVFLGIGKRQREKMFAKALLFDQVKKFIFAPKLQHLGLAAVWLSGLDSLPLPRSLRTTYIECVGSAWLEEACSDVWRKISKLELPPATEVAVLLDRTGSRAGLCSGDLMGFDWEVPNVTKVSLTYRAGHPDFLPPDGLKNLRELELSMDWWHDRDEGRSAAYQLASGSFQASSFPSLKKVNLHISEDYVEPFIDALAAAAPKLEVVELIWTGHTGSIWSDHTVSPVSIYSLESSAASFNELVNLRYLQITLKNWKPVKLSAALDFCLDLRSTISLVDIFGVFSVDGQSARVNRIYELLQQRGKLVCLTELLGHELKQLRGSQTVGYLERGCVGFNIIVRDR